MRDILKMKLKMDGFDLRDDNCIYDRNGEMIARNVTMTGEHSDCIMFDLDLLNPNVDLGIETKPYTLH